MTLGPWNDPREYRQELWSGRTDPIRRGDDIRDVLRRAIETGTPYRRRGETVHSGEGLADLFETRTYRHARIGYDATLGADGSVKVLLKGNLWGSEDRDQRFRIQHRREEGPTASIPFDEYDTWVRYQFGDVESDASARNGWPRFQPTQRPIDEDRSLPWADLFPLDRRLLAEVELVRNPAFARYRLRELDDWEDVRDDLKWDLDAFSIGP